MTKLDLNSITVCDKLTWAIIPARAGSKGLIRKCMRTVGGTSLIGRAVKSAEAAISVNDVFCNTDDHEFMEEARFYGAKVPFMRPDHLAQDDSSCIDLINHFLKWSARINQVLPEYLLLIQPTTPLLQADDIDAAFKLLEENTDAVVSVCETEVMPDWLRRSDDDGFLTVLNKLDTAQHSPRQKMSKTWRLNGGLYWVRIKTYVAEQSFLPEKTRHYEMPRERSIDIDTEMDLKYANFLLGDDDETVNPFTGLLNNTVEVTL
ncbi:MAG: acylneuraminate cytidylyltransferase family protein [Lentisphaeria bacterium]|nr:acylneuraminate cytidylyltransferase family protein [Lentisphaeria bacterium]